MPTWWVPDFARKNIEVEVGLKGEGIEVGSCIILIALHM
jgi:hypothetical protein